MLEIAGIMSDRPLTEVNDQLEAAKAAAFELGVSRGIDPFMTLSFMALPVIPKLRITTRGVIDVETQQIKGVVIDQKSKETLIGAVVTVDGTNVKAICLSPTTQKWRVSSVH